MVSMLSPFCLSVECTLPSIVHASSITPADDDPAAYDTEITVVCASGYVLSDEPDKTEYKAKCQSDGTWSRTDTCVGE